MIQQSLARHPRLAQAGYAVQAAQGRALQAGLYPNPTVAITLDEMSDVQGRGGIITAPLISQEIVTAKKLKLDRAVANREMDQAGLELTVRRYALMADVRGAYYDVLAAERRVEILSKFVPLTQSSVDRAEKMLEANVGRKLDVVLLRVELNRAHAEHETAKRERDAAWRRLAAVSGVPELLNAPLSGTIDDSLPEYDFDIARDYIVEAHPEVASARVGIERAELAARRARAAAIPNVTIGGGYVRQNQNQSNDWTLQVSVPVPAWNRNQGNRLAAQAEIGRSIEEVGRVQLDLSNRLAVAHGRYSAARKRAELYRDSLIPETEKAFELNEQARRVGQPGFDLLTVLLVQRSFFDARTEYVRALAEAWKAAAELSGLLLEDQWPTPLVATPAPVAPPK